MGSAAKRFAIPKCVLTKSSEFFQACHRGDWQEVSTKTVKLPEVDVESFSIYLQWLYTGEIVVSEEGLDDDANMRLLPETERQRLGHQHHFPLLKLAVLADKLGDAQLSNNVTDAVIRVARILCIGLSPEHIRLIYEQLPENSTFRRLVVDFYKVKVRVSFLMENKAHFPADFIFDLMVDLKKDKAMSKSSAEKYPGDHCKYHQHNDKVPQCSKD